MKNILTIFTLFVVQFVFAQEKHEVKPYLPEIVTQFPTVRDFTMSNSRSEAYFTTQSYSGDFSIIIEVKKENDQWTKPEVASFSGKYHDLEPFLSPDELTLFFASNRPIDKASDKTKDYDIWYVQRRNKNEDWSAPQNLGKPINTEGNEFYPAITSSRNLYFTSVRPDSKGKDDIFLSKWEGGAYSNPISLSDSINTTGYEFNAYVAPDESFLIFSGYNRKDGVGSGDLYISFQTEQRTWTKAVNLGAEINSDKMDYCPFVDLNTNTLFFTSKRSSLNGKPSEFSTILKFLDAMDKYENGLSRLYNVSIEHLLSSGLSKSLFKNY